MRKKVILIIISLFISILILCFNGNKTFAVTQTVSSDINSIDSSKYPLIKEAIQALQQEHPNWNFKVFYTGLDWSEVIANEYVGHGASPRNLVPASSSYSGEWICSICGETTYDSGNWRCASQKAIQYMMDPRNSLNSSDIFQFMELTYTDYNIDTINAMVAGTFLENESYINTIISSSQKYNVNAYYVIARILQEQGSSGSTLVKGEGYNGQYVGVYNVFNIGASGNGTATVILNGLARAEKEGWTSIELSIDGGIEIVAEQYIAKGQNTLYLQKFDVDNSYSGMYWHQYMQNLLAAQNEGTKLRTTFESYNSIEKEYTFIIPVYENMPSTACARPNSGSTTTPSTDTTTYVDLVQCNADPSLKLRDAPNGTDTGERIYLGEIVTRLEKATEKVNGTYWDLVMKSNGVTGYVARETSDSESGYKLYLISLAEEDDTSTSEETDDIVKNDKVKINNTSNKITTVPNATISELKELVGEDAIIKNANGEIVADDSKLATGYTVNDQFVVSVLGDVNEDGKVDTIDGLNALKYDVGLIELNQSQLDALDVNRDGKVNTIDCLTLLKYDVGLVQIEL